MAGAAGRGERGEADDERGAQRRREEEAADAEHGARIVRMSCGPGTRRRARRGAGQASARNERSEWRREGYPPGGTRPRSGLGRVARSRSDAPKPIADGIDALDILTVVVLVMVIIIATRTMVLTGIAAIVVLRRALSPIASTARTWMPGLTTA